MAEIAKIRTAERKDCEAIAQLIRELADYEKMPEKALLTGKGNLKNIFNINYCATDYYIFKILI